MALTPPNTNEREHAAPEQLPDIFEEAEQRVAQSPVEQERQREAARQELEQSVLNPTIESTAHEAPRSAPVSATTSARAIDPVTQEIETILSDDLAPLYAKLSPQQKVIFKREGETAALKIRSLLEETKLKAKSLVEILKRWLKLIPGVNKFFLEQEAKIKSDKLLALHDKIHSHE